MITTSHAILNMALLGRKNKPQRNWSAFWGAVVPDLPMMLFFFLIPNLSQLFHFSLTHRFFYYPHYRVFSDWSHSFPLAAAGFLVCLLLKKEWGWVFFLSMFLHDLEDFFVHAVYPHAQFLPLTHWRFYGPFSYYDPDYHGALIATLEWVLVMAGSWMIAKRGVRPWAQVLLLTVAIFQGTWLVYAFTGLHW
jgi:hypothetical protein